MVRNLCLVLASFANKQVQLRARACTFACDLSRLCVRVRARIGSAYRPRDTLRYVVCIMQSLCKPKMSLPPLPTVTVAYSVDGQWHVQRMNVMAIVVFFLPPTAQSAAPRKAKRAPPPRCPSPQFLAGVLEALCASGLDDTLQVEKNPHVRLSWIPLLSACRLRGDGPERERFGKLEHWSALIESTGAPSIVCSEHCTCARSGSSSWSAANQPTPSPSTQGAPSAGSGRRPG